MEAIQLWRDGQVLAVYTLGQVPLDVGSDPSSDIVVHDMDVEPHRYLLEPRQGCVWLHDARPGHREESVPLASRLPYPIGAEHSLLRVEVSLREAPTESDTELLESAHLPALPRRIAVGEGPASRTFRLGVRPMHVGTDPICDIRLLDPCVSRVHCRIDPAGREVVVRDLRSRNGTWVEGMRLGVARARVGTRLRVGRTTLTLLAERESSVAHVSSVDFVAASASMVALVAQARQMASLDWPVLIEGESGVGKEGAARLLHTQGARSDGPFVALNAAAIPPGLVESELFGHERGAFSGASGVHRGLFEQAAGGTLFLDEVGELPVELQARLLRVLEAGTVRRVGAEREIAVSARLLCATHRDLRARVSGGFFRQDLYFRLARLVLRVPPLRERPDDIVVLAEHFLRRIAQDLGPRTLEAAAVERLILHTWPGNVRELRNVLELAAVKACGNEIARADVEAAIEGITPPLLAGDSALAGLRKVVELHRGNVASAARSLGLPRTTLRDRLASERGRSV